MVLEARRGQVRRDSIRSGRDTLGRHHARRIVGSGIALEVLDWGASGPPLLLLAGLGNTAHVFDEFAQHFTDRFHVLGITRRGFGCSSQPDSGYDVRTLATDIRTVLDRLEGLERPDYAHVRASALAIYQPTISGSVFRTTNTSTKRTKREPRR